MSQTFFLNFSIFFYLFHFYQYLAKLDLLILNESSALFCSYTHYQGETINQLYTYYVFIISKFFSFM